MKTTSCLEKILDLFAQYYDINTKTPAAPFSAEAEFHSQSEQYFLTKAAKIAQIDSAEYVFFAQMPLLTAEILSELDKTAWETGLSRVKITSSHRNSDVTLVILAEKAEKDAVLRLKKLRHYKSYRFGLLGWSNYRAILLEKSTECVSSNRLGRDFAKIFRKKINSEE